MKKLRLQVRKNINEEVLIGEELVPILKGFEMNVLSKDTQIGDIIVTSSGGVYINLETNLEPSVIKEAITVIFEKLEIVERESKQEPIGGAETEQLQ